MSAVDNKTKVKYAIKAIGVRCIEEDYKDDNARQSFLEEI